MILDDTKNAVLKNSYGGTSGFFKAAVDLYMHDIITKTKEENKAQLKCYAGSAGAVIYDNGVLSSCENKPDVLNLRDYDWNCYYPSLPFNPGHLIKIKRLEKDMKKAAKQLAAVQSPVEATV